MQLNALRRPSLVVASWMGVVLPLCLTFGLSCGNWRVAQRSEVEPVERVTCIPKLGLPDAAVQNVASAGAAGATSIAGAIGGAAGAAAVIDVTAGAAGAPGVTDSAVDAANLRPHVERAILVSVDGLGGKYLEEQLGKGQLPAFAALQRAGASTLNARSDYDDNYTLPNHTSILTGRPVNRDVDLPANVHHGWTINGIVDASYTLHNSGNSALKYVASAFDVAHDHGKKTCMYAGKLKFSLYANSYNGVNGASDLIGADNGRNKVDRVVLLENNTELLLSTAEADIAGGVCDFTFIHIADLDTIGHATGWGSEAWYAGLERVDGWIQRLARFTNESDAGTPLGLVVTADHGGGTYGHGDPTDIWDYQIPFFGVGPGYTPNTDLYRLASSSRCDPGLVRPRYSVTLQPIRNADASNAVLAMLLLPPVPGSLMRNLLASK